MKTAIICTIGLVGSWGHAAAESVVEGRVRLDSGAPVPGAQVLLFDLADLRAAPLAATTDRSGHFTLPLATLGGALPERFELGANYPNPFNPSTMIPYQLPAAMHVRLEVFNILGQRIATLVDGERPAGFHTASWDATDAAGEAVGAGVYLYRLSGDGVQATRSMLLIDGQAGIPSGRGGSSGSGGEAGAGEDGEAAPAYGLTVSGPGLVAYVDPAFRVQAGMAPLDLVVEAPGRVPTAKAASSGGILGDVDNTGDVDFFDALLVALYSHDSSTVMPNNGDIISLGDVNADGRVDLSDAWAIAAYLNDPSDPSLPAGIGEPVGPAASLSPEPSTVTFADDGAWHRFTVAAGEPVTVVANPQGTTPRLEITTRSGRGNYCPAEADDNQSRQDGQTIYLSGCSSGQATVELRRESDGTVLRTWRPGRDLRRGQATGRGGSDPHPTAARQPDGDFVCDDGPQSGTRNADAGAGAIQLFARQTPGGVDLPDLGHSASSLHSARRAPHSAQGRVDPDPELQSKSGKRSVAFPRNTAA